MNGDADLFEGIGDLHLGELAFLHDMPRVTHSADFERYISYVVCQTCRCWLGIHQVQRPTWSTPMSNSAPPQLTLSGAVHDGNPMYPKVGDVRIFPGIRRATYIDGCVFDGQQWREMDLNSFGGVGRTFDGREDIGTVMRSISATTQSHQGHPIHYDRQGTSKKSRYIFYGIPLSSIFP